jgi:hypothetical protein
MYAAGSQLSALTLINIHWYANAAVCYAYLSDIQWCSDRNQLENRLSASRWFTRGWTLQELIAPSRVVFYSAEWREIGTKSQLCRQISSITGIDEHILNGGDLGNVCVATTKVHGFSLSFSSFFTKMSPKIAPKISLRFPEIVV